jgi:hypothetical protein
MALQLLYRVLAFSTNSFHLLLSWARVNYNFSSWNYLASGSTVISEGMWKWLWSNCFTIPSLSLDRQRKASETFGRDCQSPAQNLRHCLSCPPFVLYGFMSWCVDTGQFHFSLYIRRLNLNWATVRAGSDLLWSQMLGAMHVVKSTQECDKPHSSNNRIL